MNENNHSSPIISPRNSSPRDDCSGQNTAIEGCNKQEAVKEGINRAHTSEAKREVRGSTIYQIPVPERFHGEEYQTLFRHLLKYEECLPIALYRWQADVTKLAYVYTGRTSETHQCGFVAVSSTEAQVGTSLN